MLILRRISLTSIAASIGSVWPVVVIECISVVSSLLLSSSSSSSSSSSVA